MKGRTSNMVLFGNYIVSHIWRTGNNNPDIKTLLEEFNNNKEPESEPINKPGLMYINWRIARYYGFDSLIVIEGNRRKLSEIRQLAYYISFYIFKYKDQQIADFYGKTRTAIVNGRTHIEGLINSDKRLRIDFEYLTNILRNGETNKK